MGKRTKYLVTYCGSDGYHDMDGRWNNGESIEGTTTSPDYWLKQHNKTRVHEQCSDIGREMYFKCKTEEEAIKYGIKKYGMTKEDAWHEWEETISVCEHEHEFRFEAI